MRSTWTLQRQLAALGMISASLTMVGIGGVSFANPTGGVVTAGSASISSASKTMTVTQGTNKLAIDWSTFNIASGETLNFVQPGSSSIALNRVMGNNPSSIYGSLNANGSVFLVNPSGVLFGKGSSVNVGSLVASTLNITDTDFLNGSYTFHGSGGLVLNQGSITTADGGYVALLGSQANNDGVIVANAGTVSLAGGNAVTLDFGGDGFLQVAVSQAALAASVANSGVISANGGKVYLTAEAADALAGTVVNNSGAIEAESLDTAGGTITLSGGSNGTVVNSGKLDVSGTSGGSVSVTGENISVPSGSVIDASATASGDGGSVQIVAADDTSFAGSILANGGPSGGDGGVVEVSGKQTLAYNGAVNTLAPAGSIGSLLLDPGDYTVDSSNVGALETTLGTTSTTISSTTNGSGTGLGDIDIDAPVTWSAATTLTLSADNNININSPITATAGGLTLNANDSSTGVGAITASAAVNVGSFTLTNGNWSQLSSTLPAFSATDFTLNGGTFVRALGGDGSSGNPYQLTDIYGVQGAGTLLSDNFILNNDIDASGTASWNGGAGFLSVGTTGTPFMGSFNGNGFAISNLTASSPDISAGLFGSTGGGTVENLGLINANVVGSEYVGALIGAAIGGSVVNCYSTGTVTDTSLDPASNVGGLIGATAVNISNSYSSATVTDQSASEFSNVGGLVGGVASGSITNCYATGNVINATAGDHNFLGGLVGLNESTVSNSYATGLITSEVSDTVGGLIGQQNGGAAVSDSYWDQTTTGMNNAVGNNSGGSTITSVTGLTDAAVGGAFNQNSYTNFSFGSGGDWYMIDGATRPFLQTEFNTNISNSHQLQLIEMHLGDNYTLLNSVTLPATNALSDMWRTSASPTSTGDYGFVPIGDGESLFGGAFSGNNNTIDGLSETTSRSDAGLFGAVSGSVEDLKLTDVNITGISNPGTQLVGSIAGFNEGTLSTDSVTGNVAYSGGAQADIGGVVGDNDGAVSDITSSVQASPFDSTLSSSVGGFAGLNDLNGNISSSISSGNVRDDQPSSVGDEIGGFVGTNNGIVSASSASGTVTAPGMTSIYDIGGFAGVNNSGANLSVDSATGNVTASSGYPTLGGFVAYNNGSIGVCSATGSATDASTSDSVQSLGGLVGINDVSGVVDTSYATGAVLNSSVANGVSLGGLIGSNAGSTSENYATGSVTDSGPGEDTVGGLIGTSSGSVLLSHATGNIVLTGPSNIAGDDQVGGLLGSNTGSVSESYATGNITVDGGGGNVLGGLIGSNGGTVSITYSYGNVADNGYLGSSELGGLVGINRDSIVNSYSTGSVSDNHTGGSENSTRDILGGFVGTNDGPGESESAPVATITSSYTIGSVSSGVGLGDEQGGFIGLDDALTTSGYWDTTTSGQSNAIGQEDGTSSNTIFGITDSAMKQSGSFGSQFDFTNIWKAYNGNTDPLLVAFLTPLTVTLNGSTETYNGVVQTPTVTYAITERPATIPAKTANVISDGLPTVNTSLIFGSVVYTLNGSTVPSAVNAGTYTVNTSGLFSNQQGYNIAYASSSFTIIPKSLNFTDMNASSTYGVAAIPGVIDLTGIITADLGHVGAIGDVTDSNGIVSLSPNTPVGRYTETATGLAGSASSNYVLATTGNTNGTLTINPAALTITASNATRQEGESNPVFTATYSNLVAGDTPASLGTLALTTSATALSPAGQYSIVPSGLSDANYDITYVNGLLTVTSVPLTTPLGAGYYDALAYSKQDEIGSLIGPDYWPLTVVEPGVNLGQ